jgi:ABC-type phosphate transport system substrate-binding protein
MSAFKQKLARLGATAGVLAASTAAIMAVGGVSASSALALETSCQPASEASIAGEGSSLQKIAQGLWADNEANYGKAIPSGRGFNKSANAKACNGTQGALGVPTSSYTSSSSGAALEAWGANGHAFNKADNYIASDDAPNATQLGEINTRTGSNVAVVPVTQTAIAVVVDLPTGCTLTKITNANLEEIFRGTLKNWRLVTNASPTTTGGACDKEITRVVRPDGSGTSYQLKHYLSTINSAKVCTKALGERTWTELQSNTRIPNEPTGTLPNTTWPNCEGLSPVVTAETTGGGALVKKVNTTPSSIGYAALPDAENNKTAATTIPQIQDFVSGSTIEYASPALTASSTANCANVPYNLPKTSAGVEVGSWEAAGTTANLDWSGVYGSDKNVGKEKFSICTLTWDVGAVSSTSIFGAKKATSISNYLTYAITTGGTAGTNGGGQVDLGGNWYQTLPTAAASNAQLAAEKAVAQIG